VRASASRLRAAGGALDADQRFAAVAAGALLLTMFLPWYEKSAFIRPSGKEVSTTISAFGAVSFVEAAVFLVSAGVLALVFARAEGGRFHLPGGDGAVILAAGLWASALIFFRVFDRPDVSGEGGTVGIQWGFFVAFVAAGALALAGRRMRVASRPAAPARGPRTRREPAADDELVTWSDAPTSVVPAEPRVPRSAPSGDDSPATQRVPRDRAVRREDAERIEVDDPPDAPLLPGEIPRAQDRGR
jgi:hypothetical protein